MEARGVAVDGSAEGAGAAAASTPAGAGEIEATCERPMRLTDIAEPPPPGSPHRVSGASRQRKASSTRPRCSIAATRKAEAFRNRPEEGELRSGLDLKPLRSRVPEAGKSDLQGLQLGDCTWSDGEQAAITACS